MTIGRSPDKTDCTRVAPTHLHALCCVPFCLVPSLASAVVVRVPRPTGSQRPAPLPSCCHQPAEQRRTAEEHRGRQCLACLLVLEWIALLLSLEDDLPSVRPPVLRCGAPLVLPAAAAAATHTSTVGTHSSTAANPKDIVLLVHHYLRPESPLVRCAPPTRREGRIAAGRLR